MKFSKVIGKIDEKLVAQAEEKLSQIFLELGTKYANKHVGSLMGGDPIIFTLMHPVEHICTLNMPTAATCGRRFYWNPKFVCKQSKIGLRIICGHEAWHALYMHPSRRGSRNPKLWNIAVDYIVNGSVMEDFKARTLDPVEMFQKHLGRYMTLEQYAAMLKDPFAKVAGFDDIDPLEAGKTPEVDLPSPKEDRDLTDKEIKELERREKQPKFYFADPALDEEMKRPEKIYDYLYALLPKCPECGRLGIYQMPKKDDKKKGKGKKKDKGAGDKDPQAKGKGKGKDQSDQQGDDQGDGHQHGDGQHDHGDGQSCGCSDPNGQSPGNQPGSGQGCDHGGCGTCGDGEGIDIFGFGATLDDHMDTEESEEKLAKRISDAMETAKRMAGHIPAGLETELGLLTAPKVKWQDKIRSRLQKARNGNARNDWTRFRSRPLFSGLLVPRRRSYFAQFGALLDTSGSMSTDDKAYGVSQLIGLDDKAEGTIVFADAQIYWSQATKIKNCNAEELSKLKPTGGGGTMFASFFADYEKNIGKCDFLIVMTDGYLLDTDMNMQNPGIDVYWIITNASSFKAPFGKVMSLQD